MLLAFVSGALWGVFAVLTKGVVDRLDDGLWALLRTPELYAWALVAIAGTAWQQSSFRAGALTASLPTMTVTEPMVGSVLGVVVLGETLRPGDAGWLTLIVAVVAMVVATAALARGEAAGATRQTAVSISVSCVLTRHRDHPVGTRLVPELAGRPPPSWPTCAEAVFAAAAVLPPRWIARRCRHRRRGASGPQAAGTFAGYGVDVRVALSPDAAVHPPNCRCAR